jgi:hypothetical protein
VSAKHPDEYIRVPRCPSCGETRGWRIEQRAYAKRNLCHCSGPDVSATGSGKHFPHKKDHPLCDHHPHGYYNQARAQGVAHDDIPEDFRPQAIPCPISPFTSR